MIGNSMCMLLQPGVQHLLSFYNDRGALPKRIIEIEADDLYIAKLAAKFLPAYFLGYDVHRVAILALDLYSVNKRTNAGGWPITTFHTALDGTPLAFHHTRGTGPGVLFCGGFNSSMEGNKALYLESVCQQRGWQFTRFDYRGHGRSGGKFADGNISQWRQDAQSILDHVCTGPQILVGSSMGAWIALLVGIARPDRAKGLLGIASAPDFTEELLWNQLDSVTRQSLIDGNTWAMPNHCDDEIPHSISLQLIESGRQHLLLGSRVPIQCPVRLLHGTSDTDVPATMSMRLLEQLTSNDAQLVLIKGADHRFSSREQLTLIETQLMSLRE